MKTILLASLSFLFCCNSVFAQTTTQVQESRSTGGVTEQQRQQGALSSQERAIARLKNNQGIDPILIRREAVLSKPVISKEQRKQLEPIAQLTLKYESFLSQPHTGLIKLFPDEGCEENLYVVRVDDKCRNWIPTSAFFSFRDNEHIGKALADIAFRNDAIVSNATLSQGILTILGDVPLENVTLSSDGIKFFLEFQPAVQNKDFESQYQSINKGVTYDGYDYAKTIAATENTTYAARIIAYKGNYTASFKDRRYKVPFGGNRLDIIVAFRIICKNEDGSINVLWKELSRKEAPTIIYPKKKDKKDEKFQG